MQRRFYARSKPVINVISPVPNDARPSRFLRVKLPPIQAVNVPVKIDIEHADPRKRIFPNVPFNDAIDCLLLFDISEAGRLIDKVINRIIGEGLFRPAPGFGRARWTLAKKEKSSVYGTVCAFSNGKVGQLRLPAGRSKRR
jgi:hypothetical protein